MSRSRLLVGFLGTLLCALTAAPALAQETTLLDAIGSLGYTHGRSIFKVGSWVRYHMTTSNDKGVTDDCNVTLMIAGEEEWWGEECFWVETTTQRGKLPAMTAATLMSTAIFEDSLPERNVLLYQRKRIADLDENLRPVEQTMRRGPAAIISRVPPNPGLTVLVDTLGTDTLKTPMGELVCARVRTEKGISSTAQSADSSQYGETREVRVTDMTPQVPVTGNAHQEIDATVKRRTWLTGHSQESSPLKLVSHSKTVLELEGYGTSGLEAKYVPVEFRRSLAEQRAHPFKPKPVPAKPAPPTR